jgi:hypothetical protein
MKNDSSTGKENDSPFIIEFSMVQCCGLNCMAYCDANGKWRGAYDNDELPEPVFILR